TRQRREPSSPHPIATRRHFAYDPGSPPLSSFGEPLSLGGVRMRSSSLLALALSAWLVASASADDPPKPPVQMTKEEDHKRTMELLGIKSIRRGADSNAKSERAANVDESKATPYPDLPDPLRLRVAVGPAA